VEAGIARILRFQHDDGGFGLWVGTPAEAHYTAYALWGLGLAREAGYAVDGAALASGAAYLKRRADETARVGARTQEIAGVGGTRAFVLYVLALAGQPQPGSLAQLYERRTLLPIYGRAYLALGLHKAGRDDLARALAAELGERVSGGGGPIMLHEDLHDLGW